MLRSYRILLLLAATALGILQAPNLYAQNHSGKEAQILKFEQNFSAALQNNDVAALERMVSADWVIISGEGHLISRESFLKVITGGDLKHNEMSLHQPTIRVYGDTALATSHVKSGGTYRGVAFSTDEISTDVIVKMAGRWVCVLTQLTPVSNAAH